MKRYFILIVWITLVFCTFSVYAQSSNNTPFAKAESNDPHPGAYLTHTGAQDDDPFTRIMETDDKDAAPDWLTKVWKENDRCLIKGNISYKSKEKIYHIPGWKDYEKTKINTEYGEQWFCTEWEAYRAGWRAPYYANRPKVYRDPYK